MGADMDEAIESLLAIGPGAELIRLNGEYGESRRDEIAEAPREHYAPRQKPDGRSSDVALSGSLPERTPG
jgi:hypothetical protein